MKSKKIELTEIKLNPVHDKIFAQSPEDIRKHVAITTRLRELIEKNGTSEINFSYIKTLAPENVLSRLFQNEKNAIETIYSSSKIPLLLATPIPMLKYADHFDYWREADYSRDEGCCDQSTCLFYKENKEYSLRQFDGSKCIFCHLHNIKCNFLHLTFLENVLPIQLNNFCYIFNYPCEYKACDMLTHFACKKNVGLIGPLVDVDYEDLEQINHGHYRGVKHIRVASPAGPN